MPEEKKENKPKGRSAADVTEFLATAHKRFDRLYTDDDHNRIIARKNLEFVYEIGQGQWDQADRDQRKNEGRPCLTSGQLRKFVAGIANQERDQRIAGNVIPVDSKGDIATARAISGIIRQIEHASDAESVYTNAGEQAIAGNVGYWRIKSEELDDSFDQEVFLVKIRNQFAVYLDPDGMMSFIEEKLTKEEFEYKYPDANVESIDTKTTFYDRWYNNDDIFVREYFYKERVETTIVQARKKDASGQLTGEARIFDLGRDNTTKEKLIEQGYEIEKEKTPKKFYVKWAKITGTQILEEGDWPGKDIPIIEVEGDWVWVEGRLYKRNLTQGAHDDQRMYNFWITSLAERYALAMKAPYLVTVKMVAGLKSIWDSAHRKLRPYLTYNHDKSHPSGPKRELPPQISTGETSMLGIHKDNIMNAIGRFEASFGQKSNERSKVAIDARANRSELSTFHFPDNFRKAILKSTRMLIDVIPHFYDTERIERIFGEDGESSLITINEVIRDPIIGDPVLDRDENEIVLNDLSVGKYDVVEGVKLMSTRRQEQLQGMIALVSGNPQLAVLLAGDIAKLQDWEGAQEIADKVNKVLPALLGIQPQEAEAELGSETQGGGLI